MLLPGSTPLVYGSGGTYVLASGSAREIFMSNVSPEKSPIRTLASLGTHIAHVP